MINNNKGAPTKKWAARSDPLMKLKRAIRNREEERRTERLRRTIGQVNVGGDERTLHAPVPCHYSSTSMLNLCSWLSCPLDPISHWCFPPFSFGISSSFPWTGKGKILETCIGSWERGLTIWHNIGMIFVSNSHSWHPHFNLVKNLSYSND